MQFLVKVADLMYTIIWYILYMYYVVLYNTLNESSELNVVLCNAGIWRKIGIGLKNRITQAIITSDGNTQSLPNIGGKINKIWWCWCWYFKAEPLFKQFFVKTMQPSMTLAMIFVNCFLSCFLLMNQFHLLFQELELIW